MRNKPMDEKGKLLERSLTASSDVKEFIPSSPQSNRTNKKSPIITNHEHKKVVYWNGNKLVYSCLYCTKEFGDVK